MSSAPLTSLIRQWPGKRRLCGCPDPAFDRAGVPGIRRWHDDRLWLADWGAHEVIAVDVNGQSEVVAQVASFPFSVDWLPDGRLLALSARDRRLLRREAGGPFASSPTGTPSPPLPSPLMALCPTGAFGPNWAMGTRRYMSGR
jgi:hypothetical protein